MKLDEKSLRFVGFTFRRTGKFYTAGYPPNMRYASAKKKADLMDWLPPVTTSLASFFKWVAPKLLSEGWGIHLLSSSDDIPKEYWFAAIIEDWEARHGTKSYRNGGETLILALERVIKMFFDKEGYGFTKIGS